MSPYSEIFPRILERFKKTITLVHREPGPGDDKGRATWTETETEEVLAIVQESSAPFQRGERKDRDPSGLRVFIPREIVISDHDEIIIEGRRYAITSLYRSNLQVEIDIKEVKK